ncbi:hypothetical protein A4X13_0g301 [Tilletia indica]|uniref:ATP-dependent DNA helicase n=1 Tax=Tilletia indica TaxID=43049 RepID=A0A177TT32_9BASI|nr:hypothetical protein A4X13_0g301 [Tilletia indica]
MFAFISMGGGRRDMTVAGQQGVYTFKLQGQVYHQAGSLATSPNSNPCYAQTYFIETDPQTEIGLRINGATRQHEIDRESVQRIQEELYQNNPYASFLQSATETLSTAEGDGHDTAIRILDPGQVGGTDPRTYNRPRASEVAALILHDAHNTPRGRDLMFYYKDGPLQRISELHPAFLPLRFPLLIPYGHFGWYPYIPLGQQTPRAIFDPDRTVARAALALPEVISNRGRGGTHKVTLEMFHAFHLHDRGLFSTLLHARNLLQEYVVDAWTMIEQDRANWQRNNQDKLRAEVYSGLQDALITGQDLNAVGRRTILPSTFTGGPRWWQARYHDAIALSREFGRPDLFITTTCNIHWREIQDELYPGQSASDRPDLVSRVFWLKLDELLRTLTKQHVMGEVLAYCYSVEFQKRGLPHAHILLFLHTRDKLGNARAIDSAVSAELPDPEQDPDLHRAVLTHMIHGPCTANQPCMQNPTMPGRCSRRYPRPFRPETIADVDGYPEYRRRANGVVAEKRTSGNRVHQVDSSWVVPYNPFLLRTFDCHMNVEVCTAISAVKYLYKYIFKGPDQITITTDVEGNRTIDEITDYLQARYVSPCEAVGRIFGFPLHGIHPSIHALDIHLENQHRVLFDPNDEQEAEHRLQTAEEKSKLLAFFALCESDPTATADLTYASVPSRYTWVASRGQWKRRSQSRTQGQIGRIYYAPFSSGEKYYLRRLLHIVLSPKSFRDLRTFAGVEYTTFRDACAARGLIHDDQEWRYCLQEASQIQTGSALRRLFCTIILNHEIQDIAALYDENKVALADDCTRRLIRRGVQHPSPERALSLSRVLIRETLLQIQPDFDLSHFPVPGPDPEFASDANELPSPLLEELSYDRISQLAFAQQAYTSLTDEQRTVFDEVTLAIQNQTPSAFFIDGPGGSGKTYVENAILAHVRGHGKVALAVASSGIAALMLEGGRTAHNRFKIPFTIFNDSVCSITAQSGDAALLRQAALIVWDEAPMQHRHVVESVDRLLRDIRHDESPFGGIVTVFSGDWRQTLPIIRGGSNADILSACLHKSALWTTIKLLSLTTNQRLLGAFRSTPPEMEAFLIAYNEWVMRIGDGTQAADEYSNIGIPDWMRLEDDDPAKLIQAIYGDLPNPHQYQSYWSQRAILHARNVDVDATNNRVLSMLPGQAHFLCSADRAITPDGDEHSGYPPETLATINPPGLPPHNLALKIGSPVMLLRNLDPSNGLCNGTRLMVTTIRNKVIEAQILTGAARHKGKTVFIPRIRNRTGDGVLPFVLDRLQFPIKLCFAMTINKSQGQSIQRVGIDLRYSAFAHGQLYVALSRTTDAAKVRCLLPKGHSATPNIVLRRALAHTLPSPT